MTLENPTNLETPDKNYMAEAEAEAILALPVLPIPINISEHVSITSMTVCCPVCSTNLPPEDVRGSWQINNHTASMDGYGICYGCMSIGPLPTARYRADGTSLEQQPDGSWKEGRWLEEPTILGLIKDKFVEGFKKNLKL